MEGRRGIASIPRILRTRLPFAKRPAKIFGFEEKKRITHYDETLKVHRLRTAEYWTKAGRLDIPFLPDFMRIPAIAGYQSHLKYAIRYLIQNIFDNKLKKELSDVDALASPEDIQIPDELSNFLSKYHSTGSVEQSFDDMRQKFAESRDKIVEWESRVKVADRSEKLKIMNEVNSTIASSLRKRRKSDFIEFAASVTDNIAPEIFSGQIPAPPGSQPMIKFAIDLYKLI